MKNSASNNRMGRLASGALAALFWIAVWQLASMIVASEFILAGPLDALAALVRLVPTADFWAQVGFSAVRIVCGTAAGYALAIALAALSWRSRIVRALVSPALSAIKGTPVACVVVVLLIWFGSRNVSAIAVFLMALPGVYFPVLKGLEELDPHMDELMRLYRAGTPTRLLALCVPGVLPYLLSASATVLSMGWKAGVAAELIGVPTGSIGERIYQAKLLLETADLFAWTIAIVAIAWVFERAALALMRVIWPTAGRLAAAHASCGSRAADAHGGVCAQKLVVGHDGVAACGAIDLDLASGDILCLLGASGAGKTTLLHTVAGLIAPLEGSLHVDATARFSAVFQESRLIDDLTPVENIALLAADGADTRALAAELLPEPALDTPVRELSGGQRRRVELVRALAAPSDIVLLDEPFTGLDANTHARALSFIARHRDGRTILLSTHDEQDPSALDARVARLR